MQVKANIEYEKLKQIGVGQGMNSEVFLVNDSQIGGILVAKEIEKRQFMNQNYFEEAQAMFATKNLNVVPVQYACQTSTHISLVMPYYQNGSLASLIETNPLPLERVLQISQELLNGLAHIHIKNYIHFDIKPSNILFSDRNEAMIADFGQSRSIGIDGTVQCPPMYPYALPPEFYLSGIGTIESDIYQVGLTLYRALNGNLFFQEQIPSTDDEIEQKTQQGLFPNRKNFMPHVPQRLRTVIRKALKVKPYERFSSATSLADALGKIKISHNWCTSIDPNTREIQWRTSQGLNRPILAVDLLKNSNALWDVKVYTDNNGKLQHKRTLCVNGLNYDPALKHLENVFISLDSSV
jgi:serine/threonine protein kinase